MLNIGKLELVIREEGGRERRNEREGSNALICRIRALICSPAAAFVFGDLCGRCQGRKVQEENKDGTDLHQSERTTSVAASVGVA